MDKQNFLSGLTANQLWKHVLVFNDLFRVSGTPDDYAAVDYVVRELGDSGVETEVHEFDSLVSHPLSSSLCLAHRRDISFKCKTRAFSASASVTAEAVYVPAQMPGLGITDGVIDGKLYENNFHTQDISGRIVLSKRGGPDAIKEAQDCGAVGFVHIWPSNEEVIHEMIVSPIWGTPDLSTMDKMITIPVVSILCRDGDKLQAEIEKQTTVLQLTTEVDTKWRRLKLPVATIVSDSKSDFFLLIGGHLDSWHEGVTDNATGNAALIELAKLFHNNRKCLCHNLKIAWWPGHSYGRYSGSTWYADYHWQELFDKAMGYINIDSPGCIGATDYSNMSASAEAEEIVVRSVSDQTSQKAKIERPTRCADQSFGGIGLPSLYLLMGYLPPNKQAAVGGCAGGWWWHSEEDTLDKADPEVLLLDTRIYADSAYQLTSHTGIPLDLSRTVHEVFSRLSEYASACKVYNFEPLLEKTQRLKCLAERFLSKAESDHRKYNQVLLWCIKELNSVLYSKSGKFRQDLAVPTPLLPGFYPALNLNGMSQSMNEYGYTVTSLKREENRLMFALNECIKKITHAINGRELTVNK